MQASPDRQGNGEDADGDVNMLVSPEDVETHKQCFTPLPSRRFWVPLVPTACQLCPSMDLLVLGLSNQSLVLHRTVTAQKLATITGNFSTDDEDDTSNTTADSLFACFRPDGRFLAVGSASQLTLFAVEDLLSSNTLGSGADASGTSSCLTVTLPTQSSNQQTITGLFWVHVGNPHPAWNVASADRDAHIFWKYAKRFCDQSTLLLPPSEYHHQHANPQHAPDHHTDNQNHNSSGGSHSMEQPSVHSILPSSDTPLNLLCVATDQQLLCYLHGRFPILQIDTDKNHAAGVVDLAVSNHLTHFVLHARDSNSIQLYSLPELTRQRYTLQRIGALACSLQEHVQAIQTNVHEVAAAWKSSLKPLDLKLDLLINLLQKYGLTGSTTSYFVQYILSGHTKAAPSLSNVMDQFFTHIQMNDQLLQRMEQSLSVAVQNVEVQFRKCLWSPTQALLFQANELLALAMTTTTATTPASTTRMLHVDLAKQVQEWSARLFLLVEMALTELVDARFRLRDFVAWLRSMGSQIKANGTALNSVQRQNAKKRRAPDVVVERMLQYLQAETNNASIAETNPVSATELVLGLRFSSLLNEGTAKSSKSSIPETVARVSQHLETLLAGPQQYMAESIYRTNLMLSSSSQNTEERSIVAVTTRLGMGGVDPYDVPFGEEPITGFFAPRGDIDDDDRSTEYKEWCVIAKGTSSVTGGPIDTLQLSCLPLTWTKTEATEDEHHGVAAKVFWTALFSLPHGCTIVEIKFYGDDGKSSLSSGEDGDTGQERRQSIGLLVERVLEEGHAIEVWLLAYDQCPLLRLPLSAVSERHLSIDTDPIALNSKYRYTVHPVTESFDEEEDTTPGGTVLARTRVLSTLASSKSNIGSNRLIVSGSRGVGAFLSGPSSVDLFDLEEDEELDEEDDSE